MDENDDFARRSELLRGALRRYFARHVREEAELDDLVQDTFVRIMRRGDVGQLEQFEAYAFETAASVIKDRARRRRTRHAEEHVPFEPDIHGGEAPSAETSLLNQEALRLTSAMLMQLPERTRAVFVLRRLEGLSHREIAVRLGISVSGVEKHMVRAMRHLMAKSERGE